MISDPVDPIAAHMGGGIIQVYSGFPVTVTPGEFKYFEVRVAKLLAGPYQLFSNSKFTHQDGFIYGFTVGTTAYMQIRAVATNGDESSWVQVKKATINKVTVVMRLQSVVGSVLDDGTVLAVRKAENRLLAFRALEEVEFTA